MSRFDDWAKSSAQGESFLRAWRRSRREATPTEGIDRRELLKKAGIVGGATLFAGPLIQSVSTPAFAAPTSATCTAPAGCGDPTAHPGCLPCLDGQACSTGTDCASGVCSSNGVCAVADNGTCVGANQGAKNQNCKSGSCDNKTNTCLQSSGSVCTSNTQCASGHCDSPVPLGGAPGTCR